MDTPTAKSHQRTAVGYYRTSSPTNVGQDKDSLPRQQAAVQAYATANDITIVREFYDAAIRGVDSVEGRPGFAAMLEYMASNGARTILVENAGRFARDLIIQETGHRMLKGRGINLVAVDSPDSFVADGPTAELIRQILGAVAQFEKAMLVSKLRGARDRKSARLGRRIEGNPAWGRFPDAHVQAVKAARDRGLSLRDAASELAQIGMTGRNGKPYSAESVSRMQRRMMEQLAYMGSTGRAYPGYLEEQQRQLVELAQGGES